ncbi:MAG: septal ring lytic transglycosylase RlpA family protein, partial [Pseudomonadota bacterium]|nr:septal ring lytic transglycosylase RlpA family protein [Pseudomonadota bacterium]
NARRRYSLLRDKGIGPLKIYADKRAPSTLYRVRIGPIAGVIQYDSIVEELQRLGITEIHLITE